MNKALEALLLLSTTNMSKRSVAKICGLSPTTISRYWRIFLNKNYRLEDLKKMTDEEFDAKFNLSRQYIPRIAEPDFAFHHRMMQLRDATLIREWHRYCQHAEGIDGKPVRTLHYAQFCVRYRRFAVKLDISMRQSHKAGDVVFVDFCGRTVPWTDPATGKMHHAQVFVAVTGCSKFLLFRAAASQKLPEWVDLHIWLYTTLGGVPAVTVPDNLKSAVTKPGKEAVLNRTYADLASHYGTVVVPARIRAPRDKAPVENGVKLVRRWVLAEIADRTFSSIEEINQTFDEFMKVVNNRPFKRLPGTRQTWFDELDKPALKPLPAEPYVFAQWTGSQKVPRDHHIHVQKHYYSVPYVLTGEYVEARATAHQVDIFQGGKLIATHARSNIVGGSTTDNDHLSPAHKFHADQTPENFLAWAKEIGPAALEVVRHQFDSKPHVSAGVRACASLKLMARDFGVERFEAACHRAMATGSLSVTSVGSVLKSGLDKQTDEDRPILVPVPSHRNIRGAGYYAGRFA